MTLDGKDQQRYSASRNTEDFPCLKERDQSMKCLEINNYDYSKCDSAFENFKFCSRFWARVKKTRLYYQVKPAMPTPEERAEIFQTYKTTGKIPNYSKKER